MRNEFMHLPVFAKENSIGDCLVREHAEYRVENAKFFQSSYVIGIGNYNKESLITACFRKEDNIGLQIGSIPLDIIKDYRTLEKYI